MKIVVKLVLLFILLNLAARTYFVLSSGSLLDKVRAIKTSADVRQIAAAVEMYEVMEGRYPPDCRVDQPGFAAFMREYLRSRWSVDVTVDAWNTPYGFQLNRPDNIYYVYSCGPDTQINTRDDIFVEQPIN